MQRKVLALLFFAALITTLLIFKKSSEKKLTTDNIPADSIEVSWSYTPKEITTQHETTFKFTLTDKNKNLIKNAIIKIEANMNHAGMVPVLADATITTEGLYEAKIKPTMLGDWILFLTITLSDGKVIKKEFYFKTI